MNHNDNESTYLTCPIRHVISQFGDKWSLLVLYQLDKYGTMRFSEIQREMSDCSQKMLSATLRRLDTIHLIHREVYAEVPPRVEYSLTDMGRSLMPIVSDLIDWAARHFDDVVQNRHS